MDNAAAAGMASTAGECRDEGKPGGINDGSTSTSASDVKVCVCVFLSECDFCVSVCVSVFVRVASETVVIGIFECVVHKG